MQDPIGIMEYRNFVQAGTNRVMTRVMVLSAKVRRNEGLKKVVMTCFRYW
jgi:hypothetical protein